MAVSFINNAMSVAKVHFLSPRFSDHSTGRHILLLSRGVNMNEEYSMFEHTSNSSIPIGEGIIIGKRSKLLRDSSAKGIDMDGNKSNPSRIMILRCSFFARILKER